MSHLDLDAQGIEKILRACGEMLKEYFFKGRVDGEWRGEQFKADVDNFAHNFLVNALGDAFPAIPIVSEEDEASMVQMPGDHFIIDPIDGTASFAQGYSGWVTQVAYVRDGYPVLAAIYAPVTDEYFSAIKGNGAYCNGRPLRLSGDCEIAKNLIDNYPEPRGLALDLMSALQISEYIESGSIALKICRVADGRADLFVKNMRPRDWDVAAPMLLLAEAGGVLTDIMGNALELGLVERSHQGLIASRCQGLGKRVCAWFALSK